MASALQLDRRFRWCLYAAVAILFATGAGWLVADQLKEAPNGEFWQAATANLLMIHVAAAMIAPLRSSDTSGARPSFTIIISESTAMMRS